MTQDLKFKEASFFNKLGTFFDFFRVFFAWWYGDIPISILSQLKRALIVINDLTSFGLILRGFFRPWKNDYNIAGWVVGIIIKTLYLPIIFIILLVVTTIFLAALVLQLAILPIVIGLIIINPFLQP